MSTSRRALRISRRLNAAIITGAVGVLALVPAASDAAVRVGANYRLNGDTCAFRGKDQLALAVNPANPQHVVATFANYLTENCEATASFDGGANWAEPVALAPVVLGIDPFVK